MNLQTHKVSIYGENHHLILDHVTVTIPAHAITVIVGKTGSGKSTLLDTLSGLRHPDEGSLFLGDTPLWQKGKVPLSIALQFGHVFQHPEKQLFQRSVLGEFQYSLRPYPIHRHAIADRAQTALRDMGLPETICDASTLLLSAGQKRRIALATTFATSPSWLFLDEPTAGLDSDALQRLLDHLRSFRQQGGSIVIVSHDIDHFLFLADAFIVLQQGRNVGTYSPSALCENPSILVEAQVGVSSMVWMQSQVPSQDISAKPLSAKDYAKWLRDKEFLSVSVAQVVEETYAFRYGEDTEHVIATFLQGLDVRAKWFAYVILSIGILLQQSLSVVIVEAILGSFLLFIIPSKKFMPILKPYLLFMVLSTLLSSLQFIPMHLMSFTLPFRFSMLQGRETLLQLIKIFLVMILGLLFTTTTTQLQMKKGLSQSLSMLSRFGLPVEALSLATALLLRFVPVIMQEVQRFSRIVRARQKHYTRHQSLNLRDVPALVIPLILSVLQIGSDLAVAMEARGYQLIHPKTNAKDTRTALSNSSLIWDKRDTIAMITSVLLLLVLLALRWIT